MVGVRRATMLGGPKGDPPSLFPGPQRKQAAHILAVLHHSGNVLQRLEILAVHRAKLGNLVTRLQTLRKEAKKILLSLPRRAVLRSQRVPGSHGDYFFDTIPLCKPFVTLIKRGGTEESIRWLRQRDNISNILDRNKNCTYAAVEKRKHPFRR